MLNERQQTAGKIHAKVADTVKGGDLVKIEDLWAVAACDGNGTTADDAPIALFTQGVFELKNKTTGAGKDIDQGAKVYAANSGGALSDDPTTATFVGICFKAAATTDTTVVVALANGL